MIPLFDLHCDTLLKVYSNDYSLYTSPLHISFDKCSFSPYLQIMAIWTDDALSNADGYKQCLNIIEYVKNQGIIFSTTIDSSDYPTLFLSIEDLRIIEADISRIDQLWSLGVRLITPFWRDESVLGGAWNTNFGLSSLGKSALNHMLSLGIIPDISHASRSSTEGIFELCADTNVIPIASHSNSFSVCNHKRNLLDIHFEYLVRIGGVVGISLCPEHLSSDGYASISTILNHIYHYLSLGGEDNICLGCDFDGISSLPLGISNISDLSSLYRSICDEFGEIIAQKIFYNNAYSFFGRAFN